MNFAAPQTDLRFSRPLHGVRGIASIIVVLSHICNLVLFHDPILNISSGFFNGTASVVLFFVLSGLVLSRSAMNATNSMTSYFFFVLRRAFRLMPLLILTNVVSAGFVYWVHPYLTYTEPLTGPFALKAFLGGFFGASTKLNGPSWSIFIEVLASILMPLIVALASDKLRYVWALLIVAICIVKAPILYYGNIYLFPFFIGATVLFWAKTLGDISREHRRTSTLLSIALLVFFYFVRSAHH